MKRMYRILVGLTILTSLVIVGCSQETTNPSSPSIGLSDDSSVAGTRGLSDDSSVVETGGEVTAMVDISQPGAEVEDRMSSLTGFAAKYALIKLRNSTGQAISVRYRWGKGRWKTNRIGPRAARFFWWEYDAWNPGKSPTFYIKNGRNVLALQRSSATKIETSQAATYEYRGFPATPPWRAINGKIYPGQWTTIGSVVYTDSRNGVWVGAVNIDRYMGPSLGYKWSYQVRIEGVRLLWGRCIPPLYRKGSVRAVVRGTNGNLDTGPLTVLGSGGTKTKTWESANPGNLTSVTLWRNSWCEL